MSKLVPFKFPPIPKWLLKQHRPDLQCGRAGNNIDPSFGCYPDNHAPLYYWRDKYGVKNLPGQSPSDDFTEASALRYFKKNGLLKKREKNQTKVKPKRRQ